MSSIRYQITPSNPEGHLLSIILTIPHNNTDGHVLTLPNWIPGSYMIRDFAKNVVCLKATCGGRAVPAKKVGKSTWQLAPNAGEVKVEYQIYAWDLSVRSAHVDQTHAFFNGTSVFLQVKGHDQEPLEVEICRPKGQAYRNWRVATTLPNKTAAVYEFGLYEASDYDELIDHPVELADFTLATFEACGVPHDVVLVGRHYCDMERLCSDLKAICEYQIRFFGEPAPMARYVFMTYVTENAYGGLEHRASTALHCARQDLPLAKNRSKPVSENYQKYLGLCSHEYFHTWNVKRIKPAQFLPYELENESHTELLWFFEGVTSYYDDLILLLSERINETTYLKTLARTITQVWRTPGRAQQTVTESSFDAWTKFYKQDENAVNAIVSYYTKGSLVALALDLKLRLVTAGKKSLRDVMAILWRDYGQKQMGVPEQGIHAIVNSVAGEDLNEFLDTMLYTTEDVPLADLLREFGIALEFRPKVNSTDRGGNAIDSSECDDIIDFGLNYKSHPLGVELVHVFSNRAAQHAGLSTGDKIIAMDNLQVTASNFDSYCQRFAPGEIIKVHAFRRDELMTFDIECRTAEPDTAVLTLTESGPSELGKAWLDMA